MINQLSQCESLLQSEQCNASPRVQHGRNALRSSHLPPGTRQVENPSAIVGILGS
jgi:hypothetical protein